MEISVLQSRLVFSTSGIFIPWVDIWR